MQSFVRLREKTIPFLTSLDFEGRAVWNKFQMKNKCVVFAITTEKKLLFEDFFSCREHAEQWILNTSPKDKKFVILDLFGQNK